jgi:ATP-binding cassette, subfamily B, bacterial HlyB/CyaB
MLFPTGTVTWALRTVCQLRRVPFAPELLLQQVPPPYDLHALSRAALKLGIKNSVRTAAAADFTDLPLPCIAFLKPRTTSANDPVAAHRIALVMESDGKEILYATEDDGAGIRVSAQEFDDEYTGQTLLFSTTGDTEAAGDGNDQRPSQPFGFRWFVPELLKYRSIWRDVLLASLVIQVLALATPVFTQVVIDKVIVHRTLNTLAVIGVALGIILLFGAALSWIRQYLVVHTGNRIDAVLGTRVAGHLFNVPPRYFEQRPTGTLVARVQGVETIRNFISGAAVTVLLDLPFVVLFLAVMYYYSPLLTLIAVAVMAGIVLLSAATTPALRRRLNDQFLEGARTQALLTEYVSGIETVKSLQMEPQVQTRFGHCLARYLNAGFATRQLANTYNVAATALEQGLMLAVLFIGAWLVMAGDGFTIGMLVAFQMFAGRLTQPLLRLVGLWQELQQAAIAVKRLADIMDVPEEPRSTIPSRGQPGRGDIEISELGFRHAGDRPYLYRGLTMRIRAGSCVAVVGASGSGKSTLAKLLQGFYAPTEGSIRIDGYDTRHLSANELRQHFGVVPQETVLFSGTVYYNLTLAQPLASFEDVMLACKLAAIHDTIEELPAGYQTTIGEHGCGLSGGQKQRIAIARALLKQPRILIFDEATSSLDRETAERLAATINQLKGRMTILFITHEVPRGMAVDEIFRLDGAPVVTAPRERSVRVPALAED